MVILHLVDSFVHRFRLVVSFFLRSYMPSFAEVCQPLVQELVLLRVVSFGFISLANRTHG